MEIFLVLAVIFGVAVFLVRKRKAEKAKPGVNRSSELAKPITVAPKPTSKRLDTASEQMKSPVVDAGESVEKISGSAEMGLQPQSAASSSPSSPAKQQEKIPEDSTLRRHYLSTRQAEKEAVSHPYPTDSTLRRHHESMLAMVLKDSGAVASLENPVQPTNKLNIPEDSTLRRHFLTQVEAEIASQLYPRPTDSTLRRHYDSQVKAKMEEYLA